MSTLSECTQLAVKELVTSMVSEIERLENIEVGDKNVVPNQVLDETSKSLVDQVLKEVEDEVLDETAKDLTDQILRDAKSEVLDETAQGLVGQVLKERENTVLDETAKGLVDQVLKEVEDEVLAVSYTHLTLPTKA